MTSMSVTESALNLTTRLSVTESILNFKQVY